MNTFKYKYLLYICILFICINTIGKNASQSFNIRGNNFANWWTTGETIIFKPENTQFVNSFVEITGKVSNSNGKIIFQSTISADSFAKKGWQWENAKPGFYSIKFTARNKQEKLIALKEDFEVHGWKLSKGKRVPISGYTVHRSKHDFGVLPSPTREPENIPPMIGVSLHPGWKDKNSYRLAALVGFNAVRVHPLRWSKIEVQQGRYKWKNLDLMIDMLNKDGFKNFTGNLYGTPRWASIKSEAKGRSVWEDSAETYPPVKLNYWTDFIKVIMTRYPLIQTWELWNEPHFKGQSVFWRGSPEEYVQLLASGYDEIKHQNPDSKVWLAGIGTRYAKFYKRILELGASEYYDILPVHGSWSTAQTLYRIDSQLGIKNKPWIQGEWHAILVKTGSKTMPSEKELSLNMLKDFIFTVKHGAKQIFLWGLCNQKNGYERDSMEYLRKNGSKRISIGGLFRSTPVFEPRLPAVVFRNFIDNFSGTITFAGAYTMGEKNNVNVVAMTSSSGKVLLTWQNSESIIEAPTEIRVALENNSTFLDWEGRETKSYKMEPGVMYFVRKPNNQIIAKWKKYSGDIFKKNQEEYNHKSKYLGTIFIPKDF